LVQRETIQTLTEYLLSNEIVFTLHPFIRSLPLSTNLQHCFVIHDITLTINEIFLIHLFSLEREATEAETCQVCQTQFMYHPPARKGNSLYKQLNSFRKAAARVLAH
jgi:hypothetical protein